MCLGSCRVGVNQVEKSMTGRPALRVQSCGWPSSWTTSPTAIKCGEKVFSWPSMAHVTIAARPPIKCVSSAMTHIEPFAKIAGRSTTTAQIALQSLLTIEPADY